MTNKIITKNSFTLTNLSSNLNSIEFILISEESNSTFVNGYIGVIFQSNPEKKYNYVISTEEDYLNLYSGFIYALSKGKSVGKWYQDNLRGKFELTTEQGLEVEEKVKTEEKLTEKELLSKIQEITLKELEYDQKIQSLTKEKENLAKEKDYLTETLVKEYYIQKFFNSNKNWMNLGY